MSVDNVKNNSSNELSDQELDGVVGGSGIGDALKKLKTGLQGGASDLKSGAEHLGSDIKAPVVGDIKALLGSDLKSSHGSDHKGSAEQTISDTKGNLGSELNSILDKTFSDVKNASNLTNIDSSAKSILGDLGNVKYNHQ